MLITIFASAMTVAMLIATAVVLYREAQNMAGKSKPISRVDRDVAPSSVYEARWLIGLVFALAIAAVVLAALSL